MTIKLIIWDLDDTLIYGEDDSRSLSTFKKFSPIGDYDEKIGPDRVVDGVNRIQALVPNVRDVLEHLKSQDICMTFGSMGPEFQMRRFMKAFQLDEFFDWEIGSYDRRDKGEKVELCIDHYNARLIAEADPSKPDYKTELDKKLIKNDEVLFVDDNMGYLGRVNQYLPGVKVLWAHFRGENGMYAFYDDLWLQYEINLAPEGYELPDEEDD